METKNFKTNINCTGYQSAVQPSLDNLLGGKNWQINLDSAEKTLTATGEHDVLEEIENTIKNLGYEIESLN